MILHIYHCNLAVIRDKTHSPGRNRPENINKFPETPGQADVVYKPSVVSFGDNDLARLVEQFQEVDLSGFGSPVQVNWRYLEDELGFERDRIKQLLTRAIATGILPGLTIDYNHEKWMAYSHEKGCLVVMVCVEAKDYEESESELLDRFVSALTRIRDGITNKSQSQFLDHVYLVPNAHLVAAESLGLDSERNLALLRSLKGRVQEEGFKVELNSFGYAKSLHLFINAHPLGYVIRVI